MLTMAMLKLAVCSAFGYGQALVLRQPLDVYLREGGGLCSGTHVVPQLYFVGAQKAATTTISSSFLSVGGLLARRPMCMHCTVDLDADNDKEAELLELCEGAGGSWHPLKQFANEDECKHNNASFWIKDHITKERNVFCDDDDWAEKICPAGANGDGGKCNCDGAPGWDRTWMPPWCTDGSCSSGLEGDSRCADHPEGQKTILDDGTWCWGQRLTTQCRTSPEAALDVDQSFLVKLSGGFPECPPPGASPVLAADFSTYLGKPNVFDRIQRAYGSAAAHVTYAVSLRDPLGRLESTFNQLKEQTSGNWGQQWQFLSSVADFSSFAAVVMSIHNQTTPSSTERNTTEEHIKYVMSNSLYSEQLERLLNSTHPSQVIVAPMMDIVAGGEKATQFMEIIQTKTGTNVEAMQSMSVDFAASVASGHLNSHAKEDGREVFSISLQQLQTIMDRDTDLLASLLASHEQINLPTYDGPRKSQERLRAWLTANW